MAKANYKPVSSTITAASGAKKSVPQIGKSLNTNLWDLLLLKGTAKATSGTLIASGTVAIWLSAVAGSMGDIAFLTFTDTSGRYAVTVPTGKALTIKIYS